VFAVFQMQKEEAKLGERIVGMVANVKLDSKDNRKSSDDTNSILSSSEEK